MVIIHKITIRSSEVGMNFLFLGRKKKLKDSLHTVHVVIHGWEGEYVQPCRLVKRARIC